MLFLNVKDIVTTPLSDTVMLQDTYIVLLWPPMVL